MPTVPRNLKRTLVLSFMLLLSMMMVFHGIANADYSSSDLQSIVGETPFYYPEDAECSSGGGGTITTLTGSDNVQQIYNFFITEGLSVPQTIGVMANLYEQSGFNPEKIQDPGTVSKVPTVGETAGWGLAQWTGPGPVNPVVIAAEQYHITTPIYELVTQLNIIWQQMTHTSPPGYSDMLSGLKQTTDAQTAAQDFFTYFEGGGVGGSGSTISDISQVESMVKGDGGPSSSPSQNTGGCADQTVNCSSPSSSNSNLSELRQNVVCLAEQQYAIWSKQPLSYRYNGFLDYSQGLYEEWCADFVSWIYHEANYPFSGGQGGWGLAAVDEVQAQGQTNPNFTWHSLSSGYTPQPGDIAIFEGTGGIGHTAIVVSVSGGTPTYIGGDEGPSPDGTFGYPDGAASSTPYNPPSESTVNEGTLIGTEPAPNTLQGYVSPSSN